MAPSEFKERIERARHRVHRVCAADAFEVVALSLAAARSPWRPLPTARSSLVRPLLPRPRFSLAAAAPCVVRGLPGARGAPPGRFFDLGDIFDGPCLRYSES